MMTYQAVADWWGVPKNTLYGWVAKGAIPYVRLGDRSVRFDRAELEEWLKGRRFNPQHAGKAGRLGSRVSRKGKSRAR